MCEHRATSRILHKRCCGLSHETLLVCQSKPCVCVVHGNTDGFTSPSTIRYKCNCGTLLAVHRRPRGTGRQRFESPSPDIWRKKYPLGCPALCQALQGSVEPSPHQHFFLVRSNVSSSRGRRRFCGTLCVRCTRIDPTRSRSTEVAPNSRDESVVATQQLHKKHITSARTSMT